MFILRLFLFFIPLTIVVLHNSLQALPEYSIKHRINRCTACHVSPVGGGVRNQNGKYYGARNFRPSKLSQQDYFMADVRAIFLFPEKETESKGGYGIMAGNFSLNAPIVEAGGGQGEIRLVYTHNIGGFPAGAGSVGSSFIRWMGTDDTETSFLPQYALVGRFHTPFGIITDEHRTYTKLQTSTTWNHLDGGLLMAANPFESFHYDLAFVNGEKSYATGIPGGNATLWGALANLRWMPASLPVALGVSHTTHERSKGKQDPRATAYYGMLSFDRMTGQRIGGSLAAEYVLAKNWNSSISGFVHDSAYLSSVEFEESEGWLALLTFNLSERLSFIYKYDALQLDKDFPADIYERHGYGLKYYFGPNSFGQVRFEKASAGHPTEAEKKATGALDAFWLYTQISI